jgi:6-pyruvoyltetrahydropterin/6-carboxytetrahydropterin synthase
VQVRKSFHFEAAHVLPHHPGKCSRLHGHSYRLEVAVNGSIQSDGPSQGMVIDFDEIDNVVQVTIIDQLDHVSLNELMPNPTSENIIMWIWRRLDPSLDGLTELVLWETATACAVFRRGDL